ncbi:beta-2 adrenergic receptor-like [Montipora foliosa]|uniref:beta-2 adrenergic receptor-like n=1 Tax=Montipora foliosa TaxID=591990 RepID=UPI0035F10D76
MNNSSPSLPFTNSFNAEQTNGQNATQMPSKARTSLEVKVIFCIIYSIISLGIVFGNIVVVSVFLRNRKLRTRMSYFLVSLGTSDIIVGCVGVPSFIYILANSVEFPSIVYILWNTIDVFGATASIWHLMMISIERFYAIGWPFSHRISSKKPYLCLVATVWTLSATLCCITVRLGSSWWNYPLFISVVSFLWPLAVIIVVYIAMFIIASKSAPGNHRQGHGARRETRIAKAILLVIGCFLIAWGPFFGLNLAYWACRSCVDIKYEVILAFKVLQYSSSLANPIIYTARIPGCYQAILVLYGDCLRCKRANNLKELQHPLSSFNNAFVPRPRGVDRVSFHRFSSLPDRNTHHGKASSILKRSKNLTYSTAL